MTPLALLSVLLQSAPAGNATGNGTNASGGSGETTAVSAITNPPEVGPIGQFLRDIGIPYAAAIGAAITFVVTFAVLYVLGRAILIPLIRRALDVRGIERNARRPLLRLTRLGVAFVAVAIAFGFAGYGSILTSLATIGAAATLAIGFALQDVLKNFVSGMFIYTDRPFRIGDWIEWGESGYAGIVQDISLRVTRVRTFDNELLTVPNSQLTEGVIKNPMAYDTLRLSIGFGIGYEDDVERAAEILIEEAERHEDILEDPAPIFHMSEEALADSYVGLTARIWIADPSRADFLEIRTEYIKNVKQRFDEEDIEIPFPQVDLSGGIDLANRQVPPGRADD
ncbi:mechanosensitive ion channel protein [Halobacteriales archaeon QS_3_64_16]|nr:MAG: mechanosensitive ion channel protein [Halobacteriales archaeon QS_3_64_16]